MSGKEFDIKDWQHILPHGVKNIHSYKKLLVINEIVVDKKTHITSNNKELNISQPVHLLKKSLDKLEIPQEEKDFIITKSKALWLLIRKISAYKRLAFEKNVNNKEIEKGVLSEKTAELITLFARGYSQPEIQRHCSKYFGIPVSKKSLTFFSEKYIDKIKDEQTKHRNDYSGNRLSYKSERLEELKWLYVKAKSRVEDKYNKEDVRICLQTLKQVKDEIEGTKLQVDINAVVDVFQHIEETEQKLKQSRIPLYDITLGRLASRKGLPLELMLHRLNTSFYKKYNGVQGLEQIDEEMQYPSSLIFNMDEIKKENKVRLEEEDNIIQEAQVIETKPVKNQGDTKKDLLERLREKRNITNQTIINLEKVSNKK